MRRGIFYHLLVIFACAITAGAVAQENSVRHAPSANTPKSVIIVEFGSQPSSETRLSDAIAQAKREFKNVESLLLPDEHHLASLLENRADGTLGMLVLIRPQDAETLSRLPGLYPDISFTIIDMYQPTYAANVQSVQFREDEGAFLLGAISGIRTTNRISVMALENDERSKMLAERFTAGVHHIRAQTQVQQLMGIRPSATQRTRLASTITNAFQEGTAIIFSMDDEIVEHALRAAKPERKMVVSANAPAAEDDVTRLMTYMVKRYDLALLDVLRIYSHKQWNAGKISLGVSGGYVDYSLNADNVELFPKDAIDHIEAIKDHLGQGLFKPEE